MSALPTRTNISGTPDNATAKTALTAIYDFIAQRLAAGTSGAGTATAAELLTARDSLQIAPAKMSNLWINSDFGSNQRVATVGVDGGYGFDNVYTLVETTSVTLSQLAAPANGIPTAMRMTQPNATPQRFGCAQIVEYKNGLALRGSNVVFCPMMRMSVSGTLRVAILSCSGGSDLVTRDVVNSWGSSTYTPGNFFISTSMAVVAVASVAVTANTWTDIPVSSTSAGGVVVPSGMTNLIMVAWTEAAQAQNVTLDIANVRAGLGAQVPIWTPPDAQQELARCMRYVQVLPRMDGQQFSTTGIVFGGQLPVSMRAVPTAVMAVSSGQISGVGAISGIGSTSSVTLVPTFVRFSVTHNAVGTSSNPAEITPTAASYITAEI
jgi:hypothetical protein